ncbi:hypothetical protein SVAN01_00531 [Stagonosporopsis vannaccii]|nr:hypothetical protein SVAN01_00531 [Stagonosporopsis vannaccii]
MPQMREISSKAAKASLPTRNTPPTIDNLVTMPDAQPSYSDILIGLIQGPVARVNIGTTPHIDTYNIPVELLRYHSVYLHDEIGRIRSVIEGFVVSKKRKLSEGLIMKVDGEESENSKDESDRNNVGERYLSIDLPVEPKVFELFLKFMYMGSYPSEVDAYHPATKQPLVQVDTHAKQYVSPYAAKLQPLALQSKLSSTPATKNSMAPPPLPTAKTPSARPPTAIASTTPYHFIPPSIHAWLLGARINAVRFMNYSMMHINYNLGRCFSLTPGLIHFVWQRTPPGSVLRILINDILVVYWAQVEIDQSFIDRHPALDHLWMQLFNDYADLKTLVLLGVRGKKNLPPCEAYFVQPQLPAVPPVVVGENHEVVPTPTKDTMEDRGKKARVQEQNSSATDIGASDGKSKEVDVPLPEVAG